MNQIKIIDYNEEEFTVKIAKMTCIQEAKLLKALQRMGDFIDKDTDESVDKLYDEFKDISDKYLDTKEEPENCTLLNIVAMFKLLSDKAMQPDKGKDNKIIGTAKKK